MNKFWFVILFLISGSAFSESARDLDNSKLEVTWELTDESWVKFECVTINLSSVAQYRNLEFSGINMLLKSSGEGVSYVPLSSKRDSIMYRARPCLTLHALKESVFHFMYKIGGKEGGVAHGILVGQDLYPKAKELVSFYSKGDR